MSATQVLYDAPGPKARARNVIYTVIFIVAVAAVVWWILAVMNSKGQLAGDKWSPFATDTRLWTTYVVPGLGNTLLAAALSIVIALPLGAIFGIARLSDHLWIRVPAGVVVEFFRAIPVLILMIFARQLYIEYTDLEPSTRNLSAVVTGLVLYNASVLAEVVRAGILSLPKGQTEAAKALGLRKTQLMTLILLPQAVTAMLPAIVSQLVVILKDTALGGAILGFEDLFAAIRVIANNYHNNTIATLAVVAVIYILINFMLTQFAGWLERKLSRRKKAPKTKPIHIPTDMDTGRAV